MSDATAEQRARDRLDRLGHPRAQQLSAGDVVELANLIARRPRAGISVLQEWVEELPLREQGTLLTAVRGCDLAPKVDLTSPERQLVAFVRWCFMTPADPREVDAAPGAWFRSRPPDSFRPSSVMHYPLHWYSHVMHAFEVVRYRHPNLIVRAQAGYCYVAMVEALHLTEEPFDRYVERLSEDRIASGSIVS